MKQSKHLFLALSALFCMSQAQAYDLVVDGIYYNISGTKASVTSGDNLYTGSVVIPATVTNDGTDYTVTAIEMNAFADCTGLTSLAIPKTVKAY